jgi:hypothetical protein
VDFADQHNQIEILELANFRQLLGRDLLIGAQDGLPPRTDILACSSARIAASSAMASFSEAGHSRKMPLHRPGYAAGEISRTENPKA